VTLPRGAGRGGGLLFVVLVVFLAYLAVVGLEGRARLVGVTLLLAAAMALLLNVLRRR
jgi:hypothetical protein